MLSHFELQHYFSHLDESFTHLDGNDKFSNIGGGHGGGGFGGGRPMGGGGIGGGVRIAPPVGVRPAAPVGVRPSVPVGVRPIGGIRPLGVRTPQQTHNRMVRNFYHHNPYPYLGGRVRITQHGSRWFLGGGGWLYGYPFDYWYPFFYAISSGDELQEQMLKAKYNISDADWNILVSNLVNDGYITYY